MSTAIKYGIVVVMTEEKLSTVFSADLLSEPSDGLKQAIKGLALANLKIPVEKWHNVECEMSKNCLNDTYMFRLRSFEKIDGLYEIRAEGIEYPKRFFKWNEKE